MACLKFTLNFTISQNPLKCQDTAVLKREFHISIPGWASVRKLSKMGKLTRCTQCSGAVLEPRVFLCLPKNSHFFGEFQAGSYSRLQFGGLDQVKQEERIWKGWQALRTCLTGTFTPLSKVPLLTSFTTCREIVLVLGQDCFIRKGRSSPGLLSARESGNHIVVKMIYLVHGMS